LDLHHIRYGTHIVATKLIIFEMDSKYHQTNQFGLQAFKTLGKKGVS
jgi:hypothetical protein